MKQFIEDVKAGKVDLIMHTTKALKECHDLNATNHFFTFIADEQALADATRIQIKIKNKEPLGKLAGVLVSVKDGICVKDMPSESSSKILRGYKPVFDATAIERLKNEDAIIIGKTIQDEFGFGSFCLNVPDDRIPPANPIDQERVCGGSSGGAGGAARALTFPHIAIGESTGGSIVNPASFCGVVGLCPTYGRVSRYGLIDYANSLDKIGPLTKSLEDAALALEVMQGFDLKDSTSAKQAPQPYSVDGKVKGMRVGILHIEGAHIDPTVEQTIKDVRTALEKAGVATREVHLPLTMKHALSTYYVLAMAEASTNLAKFCGIRYGNHEKLEGDFNEYFGRVRSSFFGTEALRRVLVGTFVRMAGYRDAYYTKAAKVRTLIIEEYNDVFRDVDAILCPTMPMVAPKVDEVQNISITQSYTMDQLTVGPNLAGLPHLSLPVGEKDGLPIGVMLIGKHFGEQEIIRLGSVLQ